MDSSDDPSTRPQHPAVIRVIEAARAAQLEISVEHRAAGARTAVEAANAIGCAVAQIVKSLVFVADEVPVIALMSGSNRLDHDRLAGACGASGVRRANADEVRATTGYAIGGIPPFGHATVLRVLVDRDLTAFDVVHAAAGLPDATFAIAPAELLRVSGGQIADLAERPAPSAS